MNAIDILKKSVNLKRYNYFFNKKKIVSPDPTLLCSSISKQMYPLVKDDRNNAAWHFYQDDLNDDRIDISVDLDFLFRTSPIDEIEELVPIYFSISLSQDEYRDHFYGLSIWSKKSTDFYTLLISGFAPGAITALDNNFLVYLSRCFDQEPDT